MGMCEFGILDYIYTYGFICLDTCVDQVFIKNPQALVAIYRFSNCCIKYALEYGSV